KDNSDNYLKPSTLYFSHYILCDRPKYYGLAVLGVLSKLYLAYELNFYIISFLTIVISLYTTYSGSWLIMALLTVISSRLSIASFIRF
ncbi:hypothetical protein N7488_008911, partial [Penicillium malachiteum]